MKIISDFPYQSTNQTKSIWSGLWLHLPLLHILFSLMSCFFIRAFAHTVPPAWNTPPQPLSQIFIGLPPCHPFNIHHLREVLLGHPTYKGNLGIPVPASFSTPSPCFLFMIVLNIIAHWNSYNLPVYIGNWEFCPAAPIHCWLLTPEMLLGQKQKTKMFRCTFEVRHYPCRVMETLRVQLSWEVGWVAIKEH